MKRKLTDDDVDGQVSIDNSDAYLQWTFDKKGDKRDHFLKIVILNRDNRKELRKVYGAPDGVWSGEFKFDVWFRDFEGERFCIMSAGAKGTVYEMKGDWNRLQAKGDVIVRFMDYTFRQLKANMPTKFLNKIVRSQP